MTLTGLATLAWIPAAPLIVAVGLGLASGLLRRQLADRSVAALTSAGFATSALLSVAFFTRLVSQGFDTPIVERAGSWFGLGVGAEALDVAFVLRLDPLSSLLCLVASIVGLAIQLHAGLHMSRDDHEDGGLQRFCAFSSALLGSVLLFVLADDMVLGFAAWVSCGVFTRLLVGFWYSEVDRKAALQKVALRQRAGDALFLAGLLSVFWQLVDGGGADLSWSGLRAAHDAVLASTDPSSEALTNAAATWSPAMFTGVLFALAAASRLFVLPFMFGLRAAAVAPSPASALIQAVAMPSIGILLLVRVSFLIEGVPLLSTTLCWVSAIGALLFVLASLTEDDGRAILTWSTASQLSIAALAVGLGAYDVALFHVVAHACAKALLFLGIATASKARGHRHDRARLQPLGLAMVWPQAFTLIGGLTLAGVPPTIAFFSIEQVLDAADRAEALPGHLMLCVIVLVTVFATAFSLVRLYYIVFPVRSSFDPARRRLVWEPRGPSLWSLGALATMCVFGGVIGVSQIFGDPFEIDQMNSLSVFFEPVLPDAHPPRTEPGRQTMWIALQMLATATGAVGARLLFRGRAEPVIDLRNRLRAPARRLVKAFEPDEVFGWTVIAPSSAIARQLARGPFGERGLSFLLDRAPAGFSRWLGTMLERHGQAGQTQGMLASMLVGAVVIMLGLTLGGVF